MYIQEPGKSPFTSAVFTVAAQVGCLTFFIIIVALVVGLSLDRWLDTLPLFTILMLVGSMPLSWVLVYWVVNRAKIKLSETSAEPSERDQSAWEDGSSDREN